jgi:hypothetical protein
MADTYTEAIESCIRNNIRRELRESCSQSQVSPEIYVLPRMSDFQPQQGEDLHNIHSPEGRISSLLLIQRALF